MHERAGELAATGASAWADTADLTDETAAAGLVEAAVEQLGRLHILVNNAGMGTCTIRTPSRASADHKISGHD